MAHLSNQRHPWRRLKKNKAALAGMAIIVISFFIAVFAYLISPDGSPNANRMILEIGGRKPGFSQRFLLLPKEGVIEKESFFDKLINGERDRFDFVPIVAAFIQTEDSVIVKKYIDDGITDRVAYPIAVFKGDKPMAVNKKFYLGTDKYGRDILSRLIIGVRVSLAVGIVTVLLSLLIGVFLGAVAGYFRGRTDDIIMWFINVVWSIPTLLLVFAITLVLGKGFWQVFIAIGLTTWVNVARLIRGQVMGIKELEFVEAGRALGFSSARIIVRHILPNVMGPVIVIAASNFATAIVIEAGLSFLGVGVQPPQPSWGLMIKENYNFIITQNPMLALAPGFAIMILVLAFNMLGNGLRDALQVKG
ncbi:MAG: ABC transporter permease [Chitinophagaceae bacterium]|nr:ABC transporter permease [Chitinophagaceae bacterium]